MKKKIYFLLNKKLFIMKKIAMYVCWPKRFLAGLVVSKIREYIKAFFCNNESSSFCKMKALITKGFISW